MTKRDSRNRRAGQIAFSYQGKNDNLKKYYCQQGGLNKSPKNNCILFFKNESPFSLYLVLWIKSPSKPGTMAKSIIILASALCFLSLLGFAACENRFFVEGKVYCDTCRAQFVTKVSEYMQGNYPYNQLVPFSFVSTRYLLH